MALDRESIERKDFPLADRGYDTAAVDAHLWALASEVQELKRSSGGRSESLAVAASERIRAIVEGAETSAAEIQRQAEDDASKIRADAENDAAAIRQQAKERAHADVGGVNESMSGMVARLEAMESELNSLFESLRTGSERLRSELGRLEGDVGQIRSATGAPEFQDQHAEPIPPAEHAAYVERGARHATAPSPPAEPETPVAPDAPVQSHAPEQDQAPVEPSAGADDAEGARLVALNMALSRTPREEIDRYLAENYRLSDRGGLLDEVYRSIEG